MVGWLTCKNKYIDDWWKWMKIENGNGNRN